VQVRERWKGAIRALRRQLSGGPYYREKSKMTAFIRTICLSALLAAGTASAQQQPVDNPSNPHSTTAKDKPSSDVSGSSTNQQVDQAEKPNPHHPQNKDTKPAGTASTQGVDNAQRESPRHPENKDRDSMGSSASSSQTSAGQTTAMADKDQMADMDHDMMKNATPQQQLQKLHMSNLHEIEMGKMAEQNGSDKIKSYAKTLQTDHQDADKQVKSLAQKKNITLSDTPKNPEMQQKMEQAKQRFSSMKGPEFDRAFANRMSMEHKRMISMAQSWKQNCKDQEVCNLIDTLIPKLQQHEQMANQLRGPTAQGRTPENPVSR
jgi:putative membrane protein